MRKKTEMELMLDLYYDKFQENYPLERTVQKSEKEVLEHIKKCIRLGKPAGQPKHKVNSDY